MKNPIQQKHTRRSDEDQYGHLHAGFFIHFGDEVRSGHVDRNARRQGQAEAYLVAKDCHRHHSSHGGYAQHHGRSPGECAASATGEHHRRDGESFGNFVQKNREEDDPAERLGNEESRGDRDAVEKRVDQQPDQNRVSLVRMDELVGVSFFSKVEMRSDGVLEEMDEQVSEQDEESGIRATQLNALRYHFDERRRQHETGAERDEVAEVGALPMLLNNDGRSEEHTSEL